MRITIEAERYLLRDFREADRRAFMAYQMDPRYVSLYDFDPSDTRRASDLFDLFVAWQSAVPRRNFQLGIFDQRSGDLYGCAGLRKTTDETAVLGLEIAPAYWGRFALAVDASAALIDHGFHVLQLTRIMGDTASGNTRIEKLARWFGATLVAKRKGPEWMRTRGFHEVDWAIDRDAWVKRSHRRASYRWAQSAAH